MVTLWLKTCLIVKSGVYTGEIINVVFGRERFHWCGNICSVRQYIEQSEVDWVLQKWQMRKPDCYKQ